jgi:hypothetical protein
MRDGIATVKGFAAPLRKGSVILEEVADSSNDDDHLMDHACFGEVTVDGVMPECNPMSMVIGAANYR